MEIQLLNEMANGVDFTQEQIDSNDSRQANIGLAELGLLIVVGFFFLRWVYLSAKNAQSFSEDLMAYSPGWGAWGWYFVPFLNLVRPYQAMKEIFQFSEARSGERARDQPTPTLVNAWWGLWILSGVLGQAAFRLTLGAQSVDGLHPLRLDHDRRFRGGASYSISWVVGMVRGLAATQESRIIITESSVCPRMWRKRSTTEAVCVRCAVRIFRDPRMLIRCFANWE